jgi:hypothetical protein
MATLEMLVKLASFGTAGVCVLAVFYIGHYIQKLPNDAPEWKARLMGKYINACVIIAVICTVSGGVNAYFNRNKIVTAEGNYESLKIEYGQEQARVLAQKNQLTAELNTLKSRFQGPAVDLNAIRPQLDTVLRKVDGLQMRPIQEVTTEIEKRPTTRRELNPR